MAGPGLLDRPTWHVPAGNASVAARSTDSAFYSCAGFYGGGSEAGSEPRRLTSVQRRLPGATPGSSSPRGGGGLLSPAGDDPIADLSHIPQCEDAAEAAVERAAKVAAAAAAEKLLRPLLPPRHLRAAAAAAAGAAEEPGSSEPPVSAAKRPLLAENRQAENRLLLQPGKRAKGGGGGKAAPAANPFSAFALPGGSKR